MSTGSLGTNSRAIEQRRIGAYPVPGESVSDWPSNVIVKDRSRIRVVVFCRTKSEEGEVSETETWPESENVDLIDYDEDHDTKK